VTYAVVTPVRDEEANLRRLAACLAAQTVVPETWVVVDDGSSDGTAAFVRELAREQPWIRLASSGGTSLARGAPIVRAFHAGLEELEPLPAFVVKLDADISFEPDHVERLLAEFERDPRLGIASGTCFELDPAGTWRERNATGPAVWGACRAYRSECLLDVLPLDEHMGWDTLDQLKAHLNGWETRVLYDLPFRHHRPEGARDGHRFRTAAIQGAGAYYLGYRVSYLFVRTLFRSLRDPASLGSLIGYARARMRREPQCPDLQLRAYVRHEQSLRQLRQRVREALRPRGTLAAPSRRT
jgi:biofilm PGA synthesis N-glycosyltransferase PgaC